MIRLALALIVMLFAGCASTAREEIAADLAPISLRDWQQLQVDLRDAPAALRTAISQTGELRLPHAPKTNLLQTTAARESQDVLINILTHTRKPDLLPDAEFGLLYEAVVGQNRQEQSYAAALAAYLTQADFNCRQPLYAGYFQRRYAPDRVVKQCRAAVPFSVATRYEGRQTVWVDPKRVSSIHFLFASKSSSIASQFGHAALRLVVCPEGKATVAECDSNLIEHLVLGFRAHIDELSLNTFKALSGDYRAYLFANRFVDVYEDYAIGEFRAVYSVPLHLEDAQRELMLRELADIHWRFSDRYQFFTRNCATMLQNALRVIWPAFSASDTMAGDFLRPDSLFDALRAGPLVEGDKLASLEIAEHEGYYFSSTRQFYDRALQVVRVAMKKPAFTNLESYLEINPVTRREDRAEDAGFTARLGTDKHLREAQIMLEEYAILRSERALMIEAAKYFEEQNFLERSDSIRAQFDTEHAKVFDDCLIAPFRQQISPLRSLGGIPDKSDLPAGSDHESACQSAQNKKLMQEVIAWMKDAKSEQWQRLNEVSKYWMDCFANLNLLKRL